MDTLTLSQIAHELRTPLTLMNSTLQLIEQQIPQMRELQHWIRLNEDLRDMNRLVTSLTSGNITCCCEETDLFAMLQNLRECFLDHPLSYHATITLTISEDITPVATHFYCDRIAIKQACTNLLKNALEATEKQTHPDIRIHLSDKPITGSDQEQNAHFLCLSVQDNGTGIPRSILPQLYDPFISSKINGTGLGLSIVRNIVQAHDGYIDIETDSSGTTFLLYLPYTTE